MTPPLSTRYQWQLGFAEIPRPLALPRDHDVVRVGMVPGLPAIEQMIDEGHRVGPLLCCIEHCRLLVPVRTGTSHWWWAPQTDCVHGSVRQCSTDGGFAGCHGRLWMLPDRRLAAATTEPETLHDYLSQMRSRLRDVSGRPQAAGVREACHA
ncbi:hypothetical protein [Streptomyces lavenduligriseus]|uniref:Uncharacterized protein n=1 Tax=Streptomyces lavenduligriseus TaxID=67315 RepID=A0ABT0P672_9ACTN|nr:hypothetical protein [Streptomyces lavenduligriseus]MCL3999239.1 hypothetical protein [Streptomyces lavenduligriseus]